MSVVRVATHFNIELDFNVASFGRRLVAWLVDVTVQVLYLYFAGDLLRNLFATGHSGQMRTLAFMLLVVVPVLTYHLVCEALMNGQSVGKKLLGVRVVAANGGRPSLGQFVIRWLIRASDYSILMMIISIPLAQYYGTNIVWAFGFALLLLAADIVLTNRKSGQRLGDLLAQTLVIETNEKQKIEDTVFLEVAPDYVPSFPQVMKLSDRDMNTLKSIYDTARRRDDSLMAETAAGKIRHHLKIETPLSAFEFLEVLMKDYNYLSAH